MVDIPFDGAVCGWVVDEVDEVALDSSGVVIRRMSRDLISPIAGPPRTRRISELLPPSSLTGQKRESGYFTTKL